MLGYLHISNLYADQSVLLFKRVYALEKVHGTSAHISWNGNVKFFAGGSPHDRFVAFFDQEKLRNKFLELVGSDEAVIYGEAYGGKVQGMSATYGKEIKFVAFDVKI